MTVTDAKRIAFLIPGSLETRTGGYEYDRRIIAALLAAAWTVDVHPLGDDFPLPSTASLAAAASVLASIPSGRIVVIDGLAFGAMPREAAAERDRLRLVALVHHPLGRETGLAPAEAAALDESERRALQSARAVVVTSEATARMLAQYGVTRDRITVVEPGTDPAAVAIGSGQGPLSFLAVGSIVPRKGFATLIDAFGSIADRAWHLTCAGSLERAPATSALVLERVQEIGLADRIDFVGELDADALARRYDRADVFVLPTFYEGYGMVVAEAIARGIPVISTPTGGIPTLVGEDAGILVPVADAPALARALAAIIDDGALRGRLRSGALAARERLVGWGARGAQLAMALERIG